MHFVTVHINALYNESVQRQEQHTRNFIHAYFCLARNFASTDARPMDRSFAQGSVGPISHIVSIHVYILLANVCVPYNTSQVFDVMVVHK